MGKNKSTQKQCKSILFFRTFFILLILASNALLYIRTREYRGVLIANVEFIPVSLLKVIKYHGGMARGHRFTAYKEIFFIGNEFGGHAKCKL